MLAQISEVILIPAYTQILATLWSSYFLELCFYWKQLSGANVTLLEDRAEVTGKIIQISGTPEQAEKAQSLLQGFILSSNSPHTHPSYHDPPLLSLEDHLTWLFFFFFI